MKKIELAAALGVSPARITQLLSTRDADEFERVPLDLLYQIAQITRVPLKIVQHPSTYLKKETPAIH